MIPSGCRNGTPENIARQAATTKATEILACEAWTIGRFHGWYEAVRQLDTITLSAALFGYGMDCAEDLDFIQQIARYRRDHG